jgi:hypothetical protein
MHRDRCLGQDSIPWLCGSLAHYSFIAEMRTGSIESTAGRMVAVPMQDSAVFLDSIFPGVGDDFRGGSTGCVGSTQMR